MLFRTAEITPEIARNPDKLVEQLYKFLRTFAYSRLKYESHDDIEDCIQETLMYMLDRFKEIPDEDIDTMNLAKYFYNRANSRISFWLRNMKRSRRSEAEYAEREAFIKEEDGSGSVQFVSYKLLYEIINKVVIDRSTISYLEESALRKLATLGFAADYTPEEQAAEVDEQLEILANAIVDEYIERVVDE